jgi:hypothetical protein
MGMRIHCPICATWDGYNDRCPGCCGKGTTTTKIIEKYIADLRQETNEKIKELRNRLKKYKKAPR